MFSLRGRGGRRAGFLVLGIVASWLAGCFGRDSLGGVMDYRHGEVVTGTKTFRIGTLPASWSRPHRIKKQLVFDNETLKATIVVDALCGDKFDDAPLASLSRGLTAFRDTQTTRREPLVLDGRAAVRAWGTTRVDGVLLQLNTVVVKKDFCLYDFVYFAPPEAFAAGLVDFEQLYGGLQAP